MGEVIPLFTVEPDWAPLVRLMERQGIPVTRENCIQMLWCGEPPEEWTGEHEDQLPPWLRGGDPPTPGRPRGYLGLTPEEFENDLERN